MKCAEVRQAGSGTDSRVFGQDDFNFIIRILVFPALDFGQRSLDARSGMVFGISPHEGNLSQNPIQKFSAENLESRYNGLPIFDAAKSGSCQMLTLTRTQNPQRIFDEY